MAKVRARLIFVSYASKDDRKVAPLVSLLSAGGVEVFFARISIPDGAVWKSDVFKRLGEAERVLVFWSINASQSDWVRREYRYASRKRIPVIPVLLDSTPMPKELSRYQALSELLPVLSRARKIRTLVPDRVTNTTQYLQHLAKKGRAIVFNDEGYQAFQLKLNDLLSERRELSKLATTILFSPPVRVHGRQSGLNFP